MFALEVCAAVRHFVFVEGNKQIALARIERRPSRLDLSAYPHLPKTGMKTTSAADYAVLIPGRAA